MVRRLRILPKTLFFLILGILIIIYSIVIFSVNVTQLYQVIILVYEGLVEVVSIEEFVFLILQLLSVACFVISQKCLDDDNWFDRHKR